MAVEQKNICWRGDMDDDCTAEWHGLLLRAEWMFGGPKDEEHGAVSYWWWAVSSMETCEELASSNTHAPHANSGEEARKHAEAAARYWGITRGYSRHSLLELHNRGYWNASTKRGRKKSDPINATRKTLFSGR